MPGGAPLERRHLSRAPHDEEEAERKGSSAPFGLDSLDLIAENGSVYLVADEVEALTLRFHGLPALAVPPIERWPALADAASIVVVYSGAADEPAPPTWIADAPFRPTLEQWIEDARARALERFA